MRLEPHRLVFIDETAVTTKMARLRGRSVRGTRLEADAPFGHWRTQTFIAGLRIDGLSVVIARHPCMLKFTRQQRKSPNYKLRQVAIDQDACNRIHTCIETFACPTFTRQVDGRIEINPDLCIGDGSCIQTCPSQAIGQPQIVDAK